MCQEEDLFQKQMSAEKMRLRGKLIRGQCTEYGLSTGLYNLSSAFTGGLFITFVGTFRSKTNCYVLEKFIAMTVLRKFIAVFIKKQYLVAVMNFCKYCAEAMTFFYKRIKSK